METAHTMNSELIGVGIEHGAIRRKDAEIKLNAKEALFSPSIQSGFCSV